MRILGIDPGFGIVGYGVIDVIRGEYKVVSYGVITTPKELPLPDRLQIIHQDLNSIIDKFTPNEVAIEELFFNTNITTGIKVAEARGVIMLTVKNKGLDLYEYTPLQIKQALTGYGRAEKRQIQEMTKSLLRLSKIPKPDDAADALAVSLTHANTNRFKKPFEIR